MSKYIYPAIFRDIHSIKIDDIEYDLNPGEELITVTQKEINYE